MSSLRKQTRRLERFRKKHKAPSQPAKVGKGKAPARELKAEVFKAELARKKESNKLVQELESLSVAELKDALSVSRQELFNLRFRHATGQLENTAELPQTRRRIARILTLVKQKEVGA